MSKRLSSLLLFHSNFPNIWEQRQPECNWSSAARICFRWIFMCQQSTSLERLPSSIVSGELNGSKKKKALWGVSCKLCITAQRPGPHFCEARPAAVKFRQGRKCFTAAHLGKTIQRMLQLYSTGWRRPSAARGKAASAEPPSGPHMKSATLVSLMERRCCISEEVEAKSIHILSVCSNKRSPCSKTHWARMRSWHQGKGNKMCSCGVGSISEADAEKRQMRWQARREETWGQLNPQNWQYVIYGHYCTERLQKQPFSISELHSHDSGRCCS